MQTGIQSLILGGNYYVYLSPGTLQEGSKNLIPHSCSYTEEAADRLCSWYLKSHYSGDEHGKVTVNYRLHSHEPRTFADYMAYDITCPKCGSRMHPVADAVDYHTLAMYACGHCNKK